jgi:hypothetical protein
MARLQCGGARMRDEAQALAVGSRLSNEPWRTLAQGRKAGRRGTCSARSRSTRTRALRCRRLPGAEVRLDPGSLAPRHPTLGIRARLSDEQLAYTWGARGGLVGRRARWRVGLVGAGPTGRRRSGRDRGRGDARAARGAHGGDRKGIRPAGTARRRSSAVLRDRRGRNGWTAARTHLLLTASTPARRPRTAIGGGHRRMGARTAATATAGLGLMMSRAARQALLRGETTSGRRAACWRWPSTGRWAPGNAWRDGADQALLHRSLGNRAERRRPRSRARRARGVSRGCARPAVRQRAAL